MGISCPAPAGETIASGIMLNAKFRPGEGRFNLTRSFVVPGIFNICAVWLTLNAAASFDFRGK
jgi:hypothetical protein